MDKNTFTKRQLVLHVDNISSMCELYATMELNCRTCPFMVLNQYDETRICLWNIQSMCVR